MQDKKLATPTIQCFAIAAIDQVPIDVYAFNLQKELQNYLIDTRIANGLIEQIGRRLDMISKQCSQTLYFRTYSSNCCISWGNHFVRRVLLKYS